MSQGPYVVGIDLGTTNCALAWSHREGGDDPKVLPIPQRAPSGSGVVESDQLPSFLYAPPAHERGEDREGALSWAGLLAREQLHRTPGRVVSSAKSWLSASHVDRHAPLLPWKGEDDVERISPVDAAAAYLDHMRRAWNAAKAGEEAGHRLEEQLVVLTVPASFDAVARELTVEAARRAGLPRVHLLEEPLAALHFWLHENRSRWRNRLRNRPMLLVVDVGGGTTDFTLVALHRADGRLEPRRHAVGDHLLAGGDNVDLALARWVEERLPGPSLDLLRFAALTHACREAKERLLAPDGPESHAVTVLGRGSAVVGGTTRFDLGREDVRRIVLDGFFPATDLEHVATAKRSGLVELGLPYAPDPAVTRNLARFLKSHLAAEDPFPEAVLFAGGSLIPACVRERILEVCRSWCHETEGPRPMLDLGGGELSLSIARGAVLHGLGKLGHGLRIGGGSRRSYYMGLEGKRREALCVLPASAEEGETFRIDGEDLRLRRGRPVRFSLFTSHTRPKDLQGARVIPDEAALSPLPPLHAVLPGGAEDGAVPVCLEAGFGELGTLDVHCIERDGGRRHRLRFELGGTPADEPSSPAANEEPPRLDEARGLVELVFERKKAQPRSKEENPKLLGKNLEGVLGRKRADWSLATCRLLWEELARRVRRRRRSEEDEAAWFHLAGFCLRPGFGAPSDDWRIETMRPLFDEGLQRRKHAESRLAWWIFWRRIVAGIDDAFQERLFAAIAPVLLPGRRHEQRGPQPTAEERREIWRLAGSCEGLPEATKIELARAALVEMRRPAAADAATWTLGRILARRPFGPKAHRSLGTDEALPLIDAFLEGPWRERPSGPQALLEACRLTGRRGFDLPEDLRRRARACLEDRGLGDERLRVLDEIVDGGQDDASCAFGESLPEGLVLGD